MPFLIVKVQRRLAVAHPKSKMPNCCIPLGAVKYSGIQDKAAARYQQAFTFLAATEAAQQVRHRVREVSLAASQI